MRRNNCLFAIPVLSLAAACGGAPFTLGDVPIKPAIATTIDDAAPLGDSGKSDKPGDAGAPMADASPLVVDAFGDAAPGDAALGDAALGDAAPLLADTHCAASIPDGTVVLASGGSPATNSQASLAIDGVIATSWNAGGYTGWIEAYFPTASTLGGIQLVVNGSTTTETYTVTGYRGATPIALGQWTFTLAAWGVATTLPAMRFAQGAFDSIKVDVNGGSSWVSINEISIVCD